MSAEKAPRHSPQAGEPGTVAVTVEDRKSITTGSYVYSPIKETPKLRLLDLGVIYIANDGRQTEAVQEVSLDIADKPGIGEIVVFLGPSGCGKSTILKAVAGLLAPTRGEVLVEGKPVSDVGRDRGMVFQAYTSFAWLTVRDNVEYGLKLRGVPAKDRQKQSDKYLEAVGLAEPDRAPRVAEPGIERCTRVLDASVLEPMPPSAGMHRALQVVGNACGHLYFSTV